MDEDRSWRHGLPFLHAGQAQKELDHNEALTQIDIALHASVTAVGTNTPPGALQAGECWIVGMQPTGAWRDHATAIAGWTPGGWRFIAPRDGMRAWSIADGVDWRFDGGEWRAGEVRANRLFIDGIERFAGGSTKISAPANGAVIDAEARVCLAEILGLMREHGLLDTD